MEVALDEQSILAYAMNGARLPREHGAPGRLRCDTILGFKMCKWIERTALVEDVESIRGAQGGSGEGNRSYEVYAGI